MPSQESLGQAGSAPRSGEQRRVDGAGDATELDRLAREQLASQFDIEEALSEHSHTIVYAAREPELGRRVALRVIRVAPDDGELGDALRRAITSAAALNHPHIVPIYRTGTERDLVWYTMRYVEGKSLAESVRDEGPLDVRTSLAIAEQLASAVYYAHRRGLAHGDVRMERVLLADREWAFVSEFDTGRILRALQEPDGTTSGSLAARVYRVSRNRPRPVDDQPALAITICECLTGTRLGTSGDAAPCERLPAVLTDARTDVPSHVVAAIRRALSDRASDRFVSVLDFVSALSSDAPAVRQATPPSTEPYHVAPRVVFVEHASMAQRRRRLLTIGGAAIALGAVAVVAMLRDERPAPPPSQVLSPVVAHVTPGAVPAPVVSVPETGALPDADSARVPVRAESATVRTATAPPRPRVPNERPRRPAPPARQRTVASPSRATESQGGQLSVSSRPWGSLYVDGELVGNTPKANLALAAGRHRIRIVRNGFLSFDREIVVRPGERVRLVDIVLQVAR
jgi:serine/threonine protein kinase